MGTPGQSWSGHAGGCSAAPHSSPLPLPFPAGILCLSLAWGQHRGCDTTGGGEKRLSSTCQGKGSTSEHSSQQNSPSCCRAERSPPPRAAPTRTASPGTRTRLAMVSQEGCVGRAAQPPCCWQDKSCWDLQCQAPVSTGQRTGRCVPQAGGTGKSCEVLAWCPVDGGSIRYWRQGWALVGNDRLPESQSRLWGAGISHVLRDARGCSRCGLLGAAPGVWGRVGMPVGSCAHSSSSQRVPG